MPANYAHYRFGAQLLPTLPADVRRPIQRFRRMFDVGLHGPDIFFYYNIVMDTPVGKLGGKFHAMSGREFFGMVCRRLRLDPTEAGQAYLYGLLAHYCLDSVCHPFINGQVAEGKIGHVELETEFDRFLLVKDGHNPPQAFDSSRHIKLTKGECATVAGLYPTATPANILHCVNAMSGITKLLATPQGKSRTMMTKAAGVAGEKFTPHIMGAEPNENCAHLDEAMLELYDQAAANYPVLLEQLVAHMTHNASLGEEFTPTFG